MGESSFLRPALALRAAKLRDGMQVADFGSAGGFFTREAARIVGPSGTVWAVDHNKEVLARTKGLALAEGLHNVELSAGNIEEGGGSLLPEEAIDFVLAVNILFSATDKEKLLEEIWRVLKPQGRGTRFGAGRALVIDWKDSFGGLGPHPTHVISEQSARTLFESGGFTFVEEIPCGSYHWGFTVRKK
ncbi:MAG: class I SAM-dependent methyltransferase [Patescibacteria group bacterium]|nr:class I SAM-dependent methyltransferase [Patescibacteria group bacterium]